MVCETRSRALAAPAPPAAAIKEEEEEEEEEEAPLIVVKVHHSAKQKCDWRGGSLRMRGGASR